MIYNVRIISVARGIAWSKTFESEDELCAEVNHQLTLHGLNNAHYFASVEDEIGANAIIAEITGDEFNDENYIKIEEISEELPERIKLALNQQLTDTELIAIGRLLNLIP